MIARFTITGLLTLVSIQGFAQAKQRKLPANLNHPAINNFAPYISLDGNSMVYLADVEEDHANTMSFTTRQGVNWKDPVIMPKSVNNKLNFAKGYALSADGKTLFITNLRSNGMGGFDLYTSQWTGTRWDDPVNMLLPANSKGHDGCPSLSLDGSSLYYMRCERMDFQSASECKLMVMKKKANGQWDTPVEMPANINTGNSQTPRIMGDGVSLVFSSDKLRPNKGGMDLYLTRFEKGAWSNPVALDFANTTGDDQYVSATSVGMYLLRDQAGQRSSELVEWLFPQEVRPRGTLRLEGKVAGPSNLGSPFITIYDLNDQQATYTTKPDASGTFVAYMNYGGLYDLSIEPEQDNFTFYSKLFDLRSGEMPMVERVEASLGPASSGSAIDLAGISFVPHSSELSPSSKQEIRRLTRFIQGNAGHAFAIEVTLSGYVEDSLQTADLTEVRYDSIKIPVTYQVDSVTTATRDSIVVKARYHNDRTLAQAKAIERALIREGISKEHLASSGKAISEALPEKRRTLISVIVH
ncbi:MAG: PD40 domain-containing protein [Cyclobacteriaceae bacterium]|nr:PD40 domain-containing protein [Cyclobacteriaceae bacterium]